MFLVAHLNSSQSLQAGGEHVSIGSNHPDLFVQRLRETGLLGLCENVLLVTMMR
jgi:hypothetical protein